MERKMGWGGGVGGRQTHWCHCLALQSYRERLRRAVAAERMSTKPGANPASDMLSCFLNGDERTKRKWGSVNFKKAPA